MRTIVILLTVIFSNVLCQTWTTWGAWADTCANCPTDTVYRGRTRVCIPGTDGSACAGSRVEEETCSCPTESEWEEWGAYTTCDKDCGFCGTQSRTRTCKVITGCPLALCTVGDATESQACSTSDVICMSPSVSCCGPLYKKKLDLVAKRSYCGLA